MKSFLLVFAFFYCQDISAQSPGLIIHFDVDSLKAEGSDFKIEMKFCEPVKRTQSKNYFTNDSSAIDFKRLTENDISCENYIQNDNNNANHYYFSNQVFAWEKIIIWKISLASGKEPMYVILPVKIKSFVTFIDVKDLVFQPGKFIWIDETGKTSADNGRNFLFSLRNSKAINVDQCSLKNILD